MQLISRFHPDTGVAILTHDIIRIDGKGLQRASNDVAPPPLPLWQGLVLAALFAVAAVATAGLLLTTDTALGALARSVLQ